MLKLVGITATVKMPWESTAVAVIMTTGKGWLTFVGTRTVLKEVQSPLHKNVYKLNWKSRDGRTINQIDHVIIK